MPRVVVVGSANVDYTVRVDRIPRTGETVSRGEFYTSFGGKGANQAVAALKAGAEVDFIARVGMDANGEAILAHLSGIGLSTAGISRDDSLPTGVALIIVDRRGRNLIAVAPGSNQSLTEQDVAGAEGLIKRADVLLVQLEVPMPAVSAALRAARSNGVSTILNPAPARPVPRETLLLAEVLTPNESEAGYLAGMEVKTKGDVADAAGRLGRMGAQNVVVTMGETGSLLWREGDERLFPPFPVDSVDSTAAGDAFNGTLAWALAAGKSLEDALIYASAAGALAVTRRGAQDSLPSRAEIEGLIGREGF